MLKQALPATLRESMMSQSKLVLVLLMLHRSSAFSLLQHTNAPTALRASDDAIDASTPDAFLAGLMNRVGDLKSRQLELPIVVLDSTLPNQRLAISTTDQSFREMIKWCGVRATEEAGDEQFDDQHKGTFGIVGVDRQTGGAFPFGVEAIILTASVASDTCSVELQGGRRFTVDEVDEDGNTPEGVVQPRAVTLAPELDEEDEASAVEAATKLLPLIEQWEALVVDGGHERQPDHLELVRTHLGPRPSPERPTDLALWVGAYVNPLPALGVALEVRPVLLAATTSQERVDAAMAGIASSIAHLDGSRRLW